MAISLFSALKDAHALDIGLVNLSMDHLWLGMDGALFFDDFKSCLKLQTTNELLPWIDFDLLDCPGNLTHSQVQQAYILKLID